MKKKHIVWLVFVLALALRLIHLDQSLWLDEATTAKVVLHFSPLDIIARFSPADFHPPVYYLFMKYWTSILGYSEVALRTPSLIFSVLTGYVVLKISKLIQPSKNIGIFAVVFFLFNPLIIYYSQEARMYSMVTFTLSLSLYFFLIYLSRAKSQVENPKAQIAFFILFSLLSLFIFYGSIFMILGFIFVLFLQKKHFALCVLTIALGLSLIILSPLLFQQLANAHVVTQVVPNWQNALGPATLKNLLLIILKFSAGRVSFEPKSLYYAVAGLWTIFVSFIALKGGVMNKRLGTLFVFPLILGTAVSFFTPLLQYFRFLFLIPIFVLLLAVGAKKQIIKIILCAGFIIWSFVYLLIPQFHREDWSKIAASIPQDTAVVGIPSSLDALYYYRPELRDRTVDMRQGIRLEQKNIVVISYTFEIYGIVSHESKLTVDGYTLVNKRIERGVMYEEWSK